MRRTAGMIAAAAFALSTASTAPAAQQPHLQTAVLAGGCFWGMEGLFEHVKGVRSVVSGYAGGKADTANYGNVSSEGTGHAEAVKISFDPAQISYAQLLRIYFMVAHDPTEVNRQGPDTGPSYRSAIFPQSAEQRQLAIHDIAALNASHGFKRPIATKVESGGFYPAEAYHQGYMRKHPDAAYIVVNDLPKLAKLKRIYPQWWKA